jgi:hypothetical protein
MIASGAGRFFVNSERKQALLFWPVSDRICAGALDPVDAKRSEVIFQPRMNRLIVFDGLRSAKRIERRNEYATGLSVDPNNCFNGSDAYPTFKMNASSPSPTRYRA